MVTLVKQLIVAEDLEVGMSTVDQVRYDDTGTPSTQTFNAINATNLPYDVANSIADELDLKASETDTLTALALKADKSDVLSLTNNLPYSPTQDYNPATRKYVQDTLVSLGTGDMTKAVYDTDGDGVVDDTKKLDGFNSDDVYIGRGSNIPDLNQALNGTYILANNRVLKSSVTYDNSVKILEQKVYASNFVLEEFRHANSSSGQLVWSPWYQTLGDLNTTYTGITDLQFHYIVDNILIYGTLKTTVSIGQGTELYRFPYQVSIMDVTTEFFEVKQVNDSVIIYAAKDIPAGTIYPNFTIPCKGN